MPKPFGKPATARHLPVPQSAVPLVVEQSLRQAFVVLEQTKPAAQGQGSPARPLPGGTQLVVPSSLTTAQAVPAWHLHCLLVGQG